MLNIWRNSRGFSYAEIMTVVAIIMVLSTVTMANMRTTGSTSELFVMAQKVISDIRMAQNMALSATDFEGESPAGGWGVFFDKNLDYFVIYADKANEVENIGEIDHVCHEDCSDASEEDYKKISLPDGSRIDRIYKVRTADGAEIETDKFNITFEPPDPKTHLCEAVADCDYDRVEIVLVDEKLNKREITVNFFGLVDTADVYY